MWTAPLPMPVKGEYVDKLVLPKPVTMRQLREQTAYCGGNLLPLLCTALNLGLNHPLFQSGCFVAPSTPLVMAPSELNPIQYPASQSE